MACIRPCVLCSIYRLTVIVASVPKYSKCPNLSCSRASVEMGNALFVQSGSLNIKLSPYSVCELIIEECNSWIS